MGQTGRDHIGSGQAGSWKNFRIQEKQASKQSHPSTGKADSHPFHLILYIHRDEGGIMNSGKKFSNLPQDFNQSLGFFVSSEKVWLCSWQKSSRPEKTQLEELCEGELHENVTGRTDWKSLVLKGMNKQIFLQQQTTRFLGIERKCPKKGTW